MIVIRLPKQTRDEIVQRIQSYFLDERGEQIGALAAENLMEFFANELAPYYYNQALKDAETAVRDRLMAIEEDLHTLEKPTFEKR